MMKIIFFGSDDFAAENLKRLLDEKFSVVACVAPPDRPSGRGLKVVFSEVKSLARSANIPVLQPENIRDKEFLGRINEYGADLFIVIAYGKILPAALLAVPKIFCINVHGSLLPKYRGAAPINWAIINGEKETGFSIIKMSPRMDAGEIIVQDKMTIGDDENAGQMRERMAKASAVTLCATIKNIAAGKLKLISQDESRVTSAPKITKDLGKIDWAKPAVEIHNLVRGLWPWPGAQTSIKGKKLKIVRSSVVEHNISHHPGSILEISRDGISVATGQGALILREVHPESGKIMPAASYAAGQRLKAGENFS